jgi:F420-0:gamma-glutamyl ligase-like protein
MEYFSNPDKPLECVVDGRKFIRHAIKTHYVRPQEDYIEIVKTYASPICLPGDILSISEKIIALCQNRIIYKKDVKVGFWARLLSRFVNVTPAGESVGNPFKMQIAIDLCGLPKVLYAAFRAGIGRIFKKKGVFYKIVGMEVIGLDGFCADAFDDYLEMGIRIPENPDGVCNEIRDKLGISGIIADANDLHIDILGKSDDIAYDEEFLKALLYKNPAGQANQQTPLILIREQNLEQQPPGVDEAV